VTKTTSFSLTVSSQTPTSCPTGQFLAQYYNNMTLSGTPAFARCETSINYDWGTGGPGNGLLVARDIGEALRLSLEA
jgi:hypothetical protein